MNDDSFSADSGLEFPKIRPVEAIPLPKESGEGICLRDPRQIAENVLVLPPAVFFMVSMFDGNHSIRDIQELFMRQYGELIPVSKIQEIISQLDRELFLESDTYLKHKNAILETFRNQPNREAAHAGTAYAGESGELRNFLHGLIDETNTSDTADSLPASGVLDLLIAPHIDLHRGGECFAYGYRELLRQEPADLYVIFGTAHHSEQSIISLTRKSYSTPLGTAETDVDFVNAIDRQVPFDAFDEEILHRDEHSIEFQILWLQHVLGDSWRGKVVPVLCGSFHHCVQNGHSPRGDERISAALDTLRELIQHYPGKVVVIAGVDFSHVGQRFGHPGGILPSELERVRVDDLELIDSIRTGKAESFFQTIEKKKDRNNVCGLSPIYMSLDAVRPEKGYLLKYDCAVEEEAQSVVTFASMAFYQA